MLALRPAVNKCYSNILTEWLQYVCSYYTVNIFVFLRAVIDRHHTNPVGTEWRWKMDPAEKILQEAVEKHQSMIRQFRGWSFRRSNMHTTRYDTT